MHKKLIAIAVTLIVILLLTACANPVNPAPTETSSPDLQEVTGTVKEIKEGLVLITLSENAGDFMLRFSEKTQWAKGVNTELMTGNVMTCRVKPEPTFAPPSQGEVILVLKNDKQ